MRTSVALSLLGAAATGVAAQKPLPTAAAVTSNPVGLVAEAVLPENAWQKAGFPNGGNIKGKVVAKSGEGGVGVQFNVELSGLPEGGPFTYHIHVNPVPENGNCTATGAHLDPTERGEAPVCDKSKPETCQVGDLAGKYGAIPAGSTTFSANYVDKYASLVEGTGAYFLNRSIVFHFPNKTRITCANFKITNSGSAPQPSESDCEDHTVTATQTGPFAVPTNATGVSSFAPIGTNPAHTTGGAPSPSGTLPVEAGASFSTSSMTGVVAALLGGAMMLML
ncbi:Cell surface superoxide dismutase [Cu-Zn] 4 [Neurospora sp. IMI 360204]|nr:Cell surface superoxide dismutase [Cu-Zn] 4 [Neurospora sp. IMI 360204]